MKWQELETGMETDTKWNFFLVLSVTYLVLNTSRVIYPWSATTERQTVGIRGSRSHGTGLLKVFSTSVLTTVTLCNCPTKTRNHFIYAQVLLRSNKFLNKFFLIKSTLLLRMRCCHSIKKTCLRGLIDINDINFLSDIPT